MCRYRLFPEVLFPEPFLDCVAAAKYFLSLEVLDKYAIDPERVAVSGDSAGGNLAAAVAQEVLAEPRILDSCDSPAANSDEIHISECLCFSRLLQMTVCLWNSVSRLWFTQCSRLWISTHPPTCRTGIWPSFLAKSWSNSGCSTSAPTSPCGPSS